MNKQSMTLVAAVLVSGGVGFIVGYKSAERRLNAEFDERLERETKGMREFYTATKKPFATPQEAVAELITPEEEIAVVEKAVKTAYHKIVQQQKYADKEPVVDFGEQEPVVVSNVFDEKKRDPDVPYIISQEEFMENAWGWNEITLTYYVVDNVLTDHREDVIEDAEKTIGPDALLSFGTNSSDPNTVHICNEKLGILFEVVQHEGSYAKEVLGLEPPGKGDLPSGRSRDDL